MKIIAASRTTEWNNMRKVTVLYPIAVEYWYTFPRPCMGQDCPLDQDKVMLRDIDWHHLDSSIKLDDPSNMYQHAVSPAKYLSELEKCIPLCKVCHNRIQLGRDNIYGQVPNTGWKR